MALIAKVSGSGGGGEFISVPQGMHLARCYRVIDLGTHESIFNKKVKHLHKVRLQFEVHGEDDTGNPTVTTKGEPMSIKKDFTLSLSEMATLRKDLQTWRGREFTAEELHGFELKNVLGAWAMISVIRSMGDTGKEYSNITAIMSVPSAIKKAGIPEGHNPLQIFSIDEPDMALFDSFSNSLQEKISRSPEWQARKSSPPKKSGGGFEDMESDIPF